MQKKILTVAIGAALASPAFVAQADVTAYGIAQVEWASIKNESGFNNNFGTFANGVWGTAGTNLGTAIPTGYSRSTLIDNNQSRFGIKATEDLGGGMTGIGVVEFAVDLADGSPATNTTTNSPAAARKMYVGLGVKGAGTLLLGRDSTPYAYSGVALDPFVGTTLEARNNFGMSGHRDGWGVLNAHNAFVDGVFFNSDSWGGAYVNLYMGVNHSDPDYTCVGINLCTNVGQAGNRTAGDLSIVAGWKGDAGPVSLNAFAGYNKNGAANTATGLNINEQNAPTALKVGVQATFVKTQTVSFQYEQTDRGSINTNPLENGVAKLDYMFLGYKGDFGPVSAVVQLGQTSKTDSPNGTWGYQGKYYALGAIYNMSKTFRAFGGYRQTELTSDWASLNNQANNRKDSVMTIGLRKDF